ncbi:lytic transglycosylase [Gluconacetobacter johannae DSM 13595]|uniref:Lytic transglycosylase domain-containing protein n=1 Tax=Gluconacetobacter johannae TaxID=112140 RepID=A0A7W4J7W4_9PROT|nr:lytic transglycosylase domain-containing protein [Gluconacetobacter johannae]MBB2176360.1 lytic transglycosylase domain-containing protein [Gluconacetobacter johannae]GBQ91696.1 lytic transglycosylase [Gluconacetobacter johannae DSM 13595]
MQRVRHLPATSRTVRSPTDRSGRYRRLAWLGVAIFATFHAGGHAAPAAPPPPIAVEGADVEARVEMYLRLLSPEGGTVAEYVAFLARTPAWPRRPVMMARLQALMGAGLPVPGMDDACASVTLTSAPALVACANRPAPPPDLPVRARRAWIAGIDSPRDEAIFLAAFGASVTADDQWARFGRQELAGRLDDAARQAGRLDAGRQALAQARLALRRGRADAPDMLRALPPGLSGDPVLILDQARWLRRAGQFDEAYAVWTRAGLAAEQRVHLPAFWAEREALAHDMLLAGNDDAALALASATDDMPPASRDEARFLTGWILLQRQHDPQAAKAQFQRLCDARALISRSRGFYWTGRALEAAGDLPAARAAWTEATRMPGTFYGQMALSRLAGDTASPLLFPERSGERVRDLLRQQAGPVWTRADMARFEGSDLIQAARLAARQDVGHARDFILLQDARTDTPAGHALAAMLALRLGMPDVAVAVARRAGREGIALLRSGWPSPVFPDPLLPPAGDTLPPGFVMAVIRQESGFDPAIVSPAGAYGLMQLLPAAARDVTRQTRMASGPVTGATLVDPVLNMRIGTAYLSRLMRKFGGAIPYVLAAYNAGPHRADEWLAQLGDPTRGTPTSDAMLDWIESIPFAETRGYIQRVEENMAIYQAMASDSRPEATP